METICKDCPRNPHSCDQPCEAYSNQNQSKSLNKLSHHYPINNEICFVTLLGEYYFDHLPEAKQTEENLDLLWEVGVYLERYFGSCSGA